MDQIDNLMKQAINDNVFPGGVLLISKCGSIIFNKAYGYSNIFTRRFMTKDTIFDLASLTKPLATTLAIMKLVQQLKLDIEQNLGSILPFFKNTEKKNIKITNLLCHNSGLPDYNPYYKILCKLQFNSRSSVLKNLIINEPLIYPTGSKTLYSDIGFMILKLVVESLSKKKLDIFVSEEIYKPLGLNNLFFININSKLQKGIFAATELCPWRNVVLDGIVHDDNAYVMGGIDGHAGLFGTANDINILLSTLLSNLNGNSKTCLFKKKLVELFFKKYKNSDRALGFDTPSLDYSSCGKFFSKNSVGHLGFTGTSFWMDIEKSIIIILLTNRIHPTRNNIKIKLFRPEIHNTIMKNIINF